MAIIIIASLFERVSETDSHVNFSTYAFITAYCAFCKLLVPYAHPDEPVLSQPSLRSNTPVLIIIFFYFAWLTIIVYAPTPVDKHISLPNKP